MGEPANIFADLPDALREEAIQSLLKAPGIRIERIISYGQATIWLAVHYS